jgi:hypothetical protein
MWFPLGVTSPDVLAGARAADHSAVGDCVDGPVEIAAPPRLSRQLTVLPLLAGMGLVPARQAKGGVVAAAAGAGKRHNDLGGADWSDPTSIQQSRGVPAGKCRQLAGIVGHLNICLPNRVGQPSPLSPANSLLAAISATSATAGDRRQPGKCQRAAGELTVAVVTGEQ